MPTIGAKAHAARLRKLRGERMVREVGKALFAAGEMIQTEAQISITAGAVSGKKHVASAPGEPPNNDTGVLANNIETNQVAPLVVEVSSNAPYAAAQEFGSEREAGRTARPFAPSRKAGPRTDKFGPVLVEFGDSKTAARPYMAPARDAKRDEATQLVRRAVDHVVRKSKSSD
ncbi:HK97 gp10 family phage protein [Novosphingobium sp. YJ-S2-02]|uniref:HK97 gp10 family phage protein n=1 Tax=Novosphingobium aureum TaxID=2792964 RepID=A0A931HC01_9SPHN|nr:HK97 gp10 family phage protein [Novosphingobium aureum]MBH0112713.1 HK97 gp10 family phage protein [Novosphingobium aureum]